MARHAEAARSSRPLRWTDRRPADARRDPDEDAPWFEASIPELERVHGRRRDLTSAELTAAYLRRIERLDPLLHAVIETNPDALAIAARRDARTSGRPGPRPAARHPGPASRTTSPPTTRWRRPRARSPWSAAASRATRRIVAPVAGRRRRRPRQGQPVRMGQLPRRRPAGGPGRAACTSTAGAPAAGSPATRTTSARTRAARARARRWRPRPTCARSPIGTETDGSIVCPAGQQRGRRAQADGRAGRPGRHRPDLAQPGHGRPDEPDGDRRRDRPRRRCARRSAASSAAALPRDYRAALRPGALARRADRRRPAAVRGDPSADDGLNAVAERAFDMLRALGATLVDPIEPPDTDVIVEDEMTVLLTEFKVGIAAYLAGLRRTSMRTLARPHRLQRRALRRRAGLLRPGAVRRRRGDRQASTTRPIARPAARCLAATRTDGIDRILAADRLDAIVGPAYGDSSAPAVAGYPSISVPTGLTDDGRPGGVWLYAGFLAEPTLLGFAFDLEARSARGRSRPSPVPFPSSRPTRASARPRSGRGAGPSGATCRPTSEPVPAGAGRRRGRTIEAEPEDEEQP